MHLIVIRRRAPKWEVNAELRIDVDSVYFNYSLNRGDKGFLAPGVIRFVFIDSPGCHYLERRERVLSMAPICHGCQHRQRGGTAQPAYARAVWGTVSLTNMLYPPAAGSNSLRLIGARGVPHTQTLSLPITSSHRLHTGAEDALCVCGHKDRCIPFS